MSTMKIRAAARVKPSRDREAEEMVADPAAYFARVRDQARRETRGSGRAKEPKTA